MFFNVSLYNWEGWCGNMLQVLKIGCYCGCDDSSVIFFVCESGKSMVNWKLGLMCFYNLLLIKLFRCLVFRLNGINGVIKLDI